MPLHAQLISQLRALKLSGMIPSLEMRLLEAQQNTLAYSEFLSLIFSDELESRNNRKMIRSLAQAGLGSEQTIESFDFTFNPSVNATNIRELATCHFLHTGDGVFFLGPTGTGKTHLAKALAHCACRQMYSVAFYNFQKLFSEIATAEINGRLPSLFKKLSMVDLLIIDDFAFSTLSPHAAEFLFSLVDERYAKRSIIITSNRAITDWGAIFPDQVIANAILDRLAHRAHHIIVKGESYRRNFRPTFGNA